MTWELTEVKRVKIILTRPSKRASDLSVTFGINGSQKDAFHTALTGYLEFISANGGEISKVDEILDAETHEVYDLHLYVAGLHQMLYVQEFHRRADAFIDSSEWQF